MDSIFYIIIFVLVFIKVMIWVCVFYARAQRVRAARCRRGLVVVRDTRNIVVVPQGHTTNDRAMIIPNEHFAPGVFPSYENQQQPPVVHAAAPPAYEEVAKTDNQSKPPSYDQAIQSPQSNPY